MKFLNEKKWLIAILLLATILRFWHLEKVPVSLFGDELDLGYQAYSVLMTGKDYSGNSLPMHFQSLAEWRTPLYLYSSVPTVALWGISPLGVRVPAALFGIISILAFYLLILEITKKQSLALLSALLMTISPWHIQYSRAGFEVTQMLAFYLLGILFFLKGLKSPRLLIFSAIFLGLTPWVYSTAKFFLPLTVLVIVLIWFKDLLKIPKKSLVIAALTFFVFVAPIAWSTVYGGGAARFAYISVFTDPTTIPEVGFARLNDGKVREGLDTVGLRPTLVERAIHNKITWWANVIIQNYLKSFSTEFLFIEGDINLRHSISQIGQLYRIEFLFLILGILALLKLKIDFRVKLFLFCWLLLAPIPSALTRDGGNHASRLFLFLPMLLFISGLGIYDFVTRFKYKNFLVAGVLTVYAASFFVYQHYYWNHYPWESERWWHAGFEESIKTAVKEGENYDKVIFSNRGEPTLIFFLGWSQFSPEKFHQNYPLAKEDVPNFGSISKLDKYYFGHPSPEVDIYSLGKTLPEKTLYVAVAKEAGLNFILEPQRVPEDLKLVKAVAYPSGEPAYYLFTRK